MKPFAMLSLASSANNSGSRVGLTGSMFSYLQQYHQTRRSPSLLRRRSFTSTTAGV
ncbi:hypothetical protein HAP47_0031605 [Bradyrhizobium sp. 41S5]|uniref:hypothetical protein n=1 Tax=Bradyrhizobium sp. 41S5 TaxID=1404443 RepID=UPI001595350C|nr:hypothetical protein [Bradyrhizobium sp. 41S5]UFX43730.1 hypothetical protein HAP47_0031605 [Bradyrhizobium sp. 41S5]